MRTFAPRILLAGLLLVVPSTGYGRDREGFDQSKKRNEVILGIGAAVANGDSFLYAPTVSVIYLRKFRTIFGNHWEAVVGLGESYGGVAWQLDAWFSDYLRIGVGFGVAPFLDALPGNPILVPIPELSVGCHFQSGSLIYSGGATGNLVYGVRAFAGLGHPF